MSKTVRRGGNGTWQLQSPAPTIVKQTAIAYEPNAMLGLVVPGRRG